MVSEDKNYIPKKGILFGLILIFQQEKRFRRAGFVVSRYEFNRKIMVVVIFLITSTIKKYSLDILFLKIWIPTDNLLFLNWRH